MWILSLNDVFEQIKGLQWKEAVKWSGPLQLINSLSIFWWREERERGMGADSFIVQWARRALLPLFHSVVDRYYSLLLTFKYKFMAQSISPISKLAELSDLFDRMSKQEEERVTAGDSFSHSIQSLFTLKEQFLSLSLPHSFHRIQEKNNWEMRKTHAIHRFLISDSPLADVHLISMHFSCPSPFPLLPLPLQLRSSFHNFSTVCIPSSSLNGPTNSYHPSF